MKWITGVDRKGAKRREKEMEGLGESREREREREIEIERKGGNKRVKKATVRERP